MLAAARLLAVATATLAASFAAPAQSQDTRTVGEVLAQFSETDADCENLKAVSELRAPGPAQDDASVRASAQMKRQHANRCRCLPRGLRSALAGRPAHAVISAGEFRPLFEHAADVCNGQELRAQLAARCDAGRDPFTGGEPGGPQALRQRHCACLQGALKGIDDARLADSRGHALVWYGDIDRASLAFDAPPEPMRDIEKRCRASDSAAP